MEKEILNFVMDVNNILINKVRNCEKYFDSEGSKELFNDFLDTYIRSIKMLNNNKLVDGLVIARSSFEVLLMLIGFKIDENCRNEYFRANRHERYKEEKNKNHKAKDYTSQSYLRNIIKKRCKNIETELNEMYEFLSFYAHPSIYRNGMRYIEKQNIDFSKAFINIIMFILILALMMFEELNIISKDELNDIFTIKQWSEWIVNIYEARKINNLNLNEMGRLVYIDVNKEFYEKSKNNKMLEFMELKEEINSKKVKIIKVYADTANKIEYSSIFKQFIDIFKKLQSDFQHFST